jgi:hypothetical protein
MNTPANDWREEFDELFPWVDNESSQRTAIKIKSFIETLLTKERARIVERLEGKKKDYVHMVHGDPNSHYYAGEQDGHNQAIDQAIDIVNEK